MHGFAKTVPIGTTIEIHLWLKSYTLILSRHTKRMGIAKSAFTGGFSRACQTMNVHACTTGPVEPLTEWH